MNVGSSDHQAGYPPSFQAVPQKPLARGIAERRERLAAADSSAAGKGKRIHRVDGGKDRIKVPELAHKFEELRGQGQEVPLRKSLGSGKEEVSGDSSDNKKVSPRQKKAKAQAWTGYHAPLSKINWNQQVTSSPSSSPSSSPVTSQELSSSLLQKDAGRRAEIHKVSAEKKKSEVLTGVLPEEELSQMIEEAFPNLLTKAHKKGSLEEKLLCFLVNVNQPDRAKGHEKISKTRILGGQEIGVERVDRIPAVQNYMMICLERIRQGDSVEENKALLGKLCEKFNRDYKLRPHKADWFDSFEFRYLTGTDAADPYRDMPYGEIVDEFYIQAPVNFRSHVFEDHVSGKEYGFLRCGIFTDLSNGLLNYTELKAIAEDPNKAEAKFAELQEMLKKLEKTKASDPRKSARIEESIRYAINAIVHPEKALEKMDRGLNDQMLMLIWEQLKGNGSRVASLKPGDVFEVAQLGLLNEETQKIDEGSGWAHYEDNAIINTAKKFHDFDGKEICFKPGIKAPYLGKDGKIYMPLVHENCPSSLKLDTLFLNTSPQGKTTNTGIQEVINNIGMRKLDKILARKRLREHSRPSTKNIKKTARAKKELEAGKSNYRVAGDLMYTLLRNGIATGVGCASAKDRTGGVAAEVCLHLEESAVDRIHSVGKKEKEAYKEAQQGRVFDPNEVNGQVVYDNNESGILKVDPRSKLHGASRADVFENATKMARMKENKGGWV